MANMAVLHEVTIIGYLGSILSPAVNSNQSCETVVITYDYLAIVILFPLPFRWCAYYAIRANNVSSTHNYARINNSRWVNVISGVKFLITFVCHTI